MHGLTQDGGVEVADARHIFRSAGAQRVWSEGQHAGNEHQAMGAEGGEHGWVPGWKLAFWRPFCALCSERFLRRIEGCGAGYFGEQRLAKQCRGTGVWEPAVKELL
jgi:hypothetical protein